MTLSTWLIFTSIAIACIISPGPAILLSITNSLAYGFEKSLFSSLGNVTGILIVSVVSALGLSTVFHTSTHLFLILKIIGALYLVYLGARQWRSKKSILVRSIKTYKLKVGNRKLFIQGLLVAITNPKAVIFISAFFPQFVDISKPASIQLFILTSTFMTLSFLSLFTYALCAGFVKSWMVRGERELWFNRIAGTIFITFGLVMLRLNNRSA